MKIVRKFFPIKTPGLESGLSSSLNSSLLKYLDCIKEEGIARVHTEIPISKPPYSSKSINNSEKRRQKHQTGEFPSKSWEKNLDFQQNFKIRGKSQKPSCTTDTKQENTVGA